MHAVNFPMSSNPGPLDASDRASSSISLVRLLKIFDHQKLAGPYAGCIVKVSRIWTAKPAEILESYTLILSYEERFKAIAPSLSHSLERFVLEECLVCFRP